MLYLENKRMRCLFSNQCVMLIKFFDKKIYFKYIFLSLLIRIIAYGIKRITYTKLNLLLNLINLKNTSTSQCQRDSQCKVFFFLNEECRGREGQGYFSGTYSVQGRFVLLNTNIGKLEYNLSRDIKINQQNSKLGLQVSHKKKQKSEFALSYHLRLDDYGEKNKGFKWFLSTVQSICVKEIITNKDNQIGIQFMFIYIIRF